MRTMPLGLLVQFKNTVYKELFSLLEQGADPVSIPAHVQKEPVAFIRLAQERWEEKLKQALNKLCVNYSVSLSRQVSVLYYVIGMCVCSVSTELALASLVGRN